MSFLFKPGGSITGTAVDPGGPSGVLIHPSEITQPGVWSPAPAPAGYTIVTDGVGGWTIEPLSTSQRTVETQLHHNLGVPASGTRYLRFGEGVITSSSGFRLNATSVRIKGLVIQAQVSSANDYVLEVLEDPSGRIAGPTVIPLATLALPAGQVYARDRSLDILVADIEFGAWVRLTAGVAAGSQLGQIAVIVEFEVVAP